MEISDINVIIEDVPFFVVPEHCCLCDKAAVLRDMIKGTLFIVFIPACFCMP